VVDADNTYYLRFDKTGKFVHEEIEIGKIDNLDRNPDISDQKEPSVNDEEIEEF
jgi:hypothetical protein